VLKRRKKENLKQEVITMKTANVLLGTINDVKEFVNIVAGYDFDADLVSGRYAVDAKSIMGIFSLDLSKPITLNIHSENDAEAEKFLAAVSKFKV
jgi:phosphotransferase system HPr-like phosphotransfer protein